MAANPALAERTSGVWDVAVVGAGLAGSLAALGLAQAGLRVILLDRAAFPRWKVCGCCLNPHALGTLAAVGLGDLARQLGAVPLPVMRLGSRGVEARLALPGWVALSRIRLDAALIATAQAAGALFVPQVSARLGPETPDSRTLSLRGEDGVEATLEARLILAADGLGGRLLADGLEEEQRPVQIAADSRIGAGVVVDEAPVFYHPGEVYMAHAKNGYLGLVRLEDGRLNLAAAFNARFLRACRHPGRAALLVLQEVGWPAPAGLADLRWRGTPALTRRPSRLGSGRVLALGDAAGYVEPFTGEGMAWALGSGTAMVALARQAVAGWQPGVIDEWTRVHQRIVGQRQWVCRAMAWLTRHPSLTRTVVAALSRFPWLSAPFVRQIGACPTPVQ
jgi:menaquinone-9 beta-reductase